MKKMIMIALLVASLGACNNTATPSESKITSVKTVRIKETPVVKAEYVYEIEDALTPQAHASTIVESNGIVIASWFGGTKEKNDDVGIWISRQINGKWEKPVEIANGIIDKDTRYPSWNPVFFKTNDGEIQLYYKIGPTPEEWWGMKMISKDNGETWSKPEKLPKGILGPIKNKPIQLANGTIIAPTSTEVQELGWHIQVEKSNDNGKSWTVSENLNTTDTFGAIQPTIFDHGNGKLQMLSRTGQGILAENWSYDNGNTWSEMKGTELPNPNSGVDGVTLKDGRHLLVYNPTGGNWGDRVPLSLAISEDGKEWKEIFDLEILNPGEKGEDMEYSYPSVVQGEDGMIHVIYTWNRKTLKHVVIDPKKL